MSRLLDHAYIISTLVFTLYSQLVMRWQVAEAGVLPSDVMGKARFVGAMFLNPWVLSSIFSTLIAGISWMLAMTRFEISYAYPWISLSYVLMLFLAIVLFGETFNSAKGLGTLLITAGIIVIARG